MKKTVFLLFFILLAGCASSASKKPEIENKDDFLIKELTSIAGEIRNEMRKLNTGMEFKPKEPVVSGCTKRLVSIDFDGDLMSFIDDLRESGFCDVRVAGRKPPQDLVLSLHYRRVPLWKVLEDAGVQLGKLVTIKVFSRSVLFTFNEAEN